MSKTVTLSQNVSKDSSFHEYTIEEGSIIVGNNQPVGSVSIEQIAKGVEYPNVQDAIGDAATLGMLPINAVVTVADGISPAGIHQVDNIVFSGTVNDPNKGLQEQMQIVIFGIPVTIKNGDTAEQVAMAAKIQFEMYMSRGLAFDFVNMGATNNILEIGYLDFKKHVLTPYVVNGLSITQNIINPNKFGYGLWQRLGSQNITFEGTTDPVTLTYFQRYN